MSRRVLFLDVATASGGAQRSLREWLTHLDRERVAPYLLAADASAEGLLAFAREAGLPAAPIAVRPWPRSWRGAAQLLGDWWPARQALRAALAAHRAELVHANGLRAGLLAALCLPRDVPLVLHHRDYLCPAWALRLVVRRAARTIVIADWLLAHVAGVVGPGLAGRLVRSYNGVDTAAVRARAAAPWPATAGGVAPTAPLVTLVADLARWKRHDLFLRALAVVRQRQPTARGLLVGGPRGPAEHPYEEELLRLRVELGLADHCGFAGHLPDAAPALAASAVVVSVAAHEPFGRTVLEALALGRPLVLAGGGGPAEIAGHLPLAHCTADAPSAIADAICTWLEHPPTAEQTTATLKAITQRFSWTQLAHDQTDLLLACAP